ncbi:transporter [Luteolibacter yonseiensis]|uniref:Transporter n=1 Tax=Luteolibacter yonseiensis TaxID=1144680 RepID=A0A934VAG4_9BACT|nr:transporter [Luteolibacter yonseiensis]MBK1816188.1 transporter [Luteolibacter yonseiensis]
MKHRITVLTLALTISGLRAENAELAKKLSNPIADLISVPTQSNYDFGIGPGDGAKWTTNIQPVIPIGLNDGWNVISRTILPVIDQEGILPGGGSDESGLGDVVQSFFFSPKTSDPIWGAGPVFLIPTATDEVLGGEKWGIGPTAVVLKQEGPWTYGALVNHLWDFAGEDDRNSVNATFLQPFVGYTTPAATTYTLNLESTYDWQGNDWTVPVNFVVSQLVKIGDQPVQFFAGARYYFDTPDGGPEWGLRFGLTFLFPKH